MRLIPRPQITSLRSQLVLSLAVPIIVLLLALAVVAFLGVSQLVRTLVERRDAEVTRLAARQAASYWADSLLLLTQVASSDAVRSGDNAQTRELLTNNTPLRQRFDELSVTDAAGVVMATQGGQLGEAFADGPLERARQMRRPVRSGVLTNSRGQSLVLVAIPYYGENRQFSGCVLGGWWLEGGHALGAALQNVQVGTDGHSYLVEGDGTVLYHPQESMVGADMSQHPAVAALLEGEAGARTVTERGERTVVGYAPVPFGELSNSLFADESWDGWGLLVAERWDDLTAPLKPSLYLITALLVATVALPLGVLAVGSRRVTAPLVSLVAEVERVAEGDFGTQVSMASAPSEIRNLEHAFNRMVAELQRYRGDIQRYVVSILSSQEEERKRIARDLHDETAQDLIILGRRIEDVQDAAQDVRIKVQLESVRNMVDNILRGVRRFTRDLRPPLLEELGLPRALEIMGSSLAREESFEIIVTVEGEPRPVLPELETGLYRLAQESLSNVRRHAQAQHVSVRLVYHQDSLELIVADDGVGFEVPDDPGKMLATGRLGLIGIHERARLFGGRATIHSSPNAGTTVHVVIPLTPILRQES
ncbi:MAG: ATP-binding protein [Anaerolineae bacterium]|jgi:signal transduction histidine kinase|nr:HAMP domain-containing protein [Chloroflexota bacterium]